MPILGETPTALAANEFSGASAYHSMQVTLRKQAAHGSRFQTTYTYSRAASNTAIYNDPNNLSLDWARSSFDRTHRFTANFDYQLPARLQGLDGGRHHHRAERTADDADRPQWRRRLRPRRAVDGYALPRRIVCRLATPGDTGSRLTRWIDTAAICAPAAIGSDGSTGYGTAGQSIMQGPGPVQYGFLAG